MSAWEAARDEAVDREQQSADSGQQSAKHQESQTRNAQGKTPPSTAGGGEKPSMKKRPLGVKVFGILLVFWGVDMLLSSVGVVPRLLRVFSAGHPDAARVAWSLFQRFLIVPPMVAVIWLVVGIGVLMLKRWARLLAPIAPGILPVWLLAEYVASVQSPLGPGAVIVLWVGCCLTGFVSLVWGGVSLWYFLRPSVKAQFVVGRKEERSLDGSST